MANPTQPGIEVINKEFKRDDNDNILCTDKVEVKFDGVTLNLAQSWENGEEMAPIFSGACWAGTVVWPAALDLCDYMSEHLRNEMVGATVVELGCGIGVPGMVARILGAAAVVLTEQDELLSLLDRNLYTNFFSASAETKLLKMKHSPPQCGGGGGGGIRRTALDWERAADTADLLASLQPSSAIATTVEEERGKKGEAGAAVPRRRSTRLDFVLCADCVFEPLYGDSWKALAKVMGRLCDAGTTVLCSVERRGDDGVPQFLRACEAEGFSLRMVYRAARTAPAPVELYEFSKGGLEGFRGAAVAGVDHSSSCSGAKSGEECGQGGGCEGEGECEGESSAGNSVREKEVVGCGDGGGGGGDGDGAEVGSSLSQEEEPAVGVSGETAR